ncbi:hypothetical protein [Pseudomonas veronii]|uniref:hypothetical protein n=1 Tax=Pseudomonas veronii TaxID=76761 RepID=UPI002D7710FF|nr:hypothetical protein [Pseudomonas veronii]WRU64898.1 hypothetical protein VPH48_10985 [Pseudomonas veronii]
MNTAIYEIALTDDVSIIRSTQYLSRLVLNSLPKSKEDLLAPLSFLPEYEKTVEPLIMHLQQNWAKNLSAADSIALARWILVTMTQIPGVEPFVLHCLHEWPDRRQSVGKVVSYGVIGTLWLAIASTEIIYDNGSLQIHKKTVVPEQIEATAQALKIKLRLTVFDPSVPDSTFSSTPKNIPSDTPIPSTKN